MVSPGAWGALKSFPSRNLAPGPEKSHFCMTSKAFFIPRAKESFFKRFLGYFPQIRVATPFNQSNHFSNKTNHFRELRVAFSAGCSQAGDSAGDKNKLISHLVFLYLWTSRKLVKTKMPSAIARKEWRTNRASPGHPDWSFSVVCLCKDIKEEINLES